MSSTLGHVRGNPPLGLTRDSDKSYEVVEIKRGPLAQASEGSLDGQEKVEKRSD